MLALSLTQVGLLDSSTDAFLLLLFWVSPVHFPTLYYIVTWVYSGLFSPLLLGVVPRYCCACMLMFVPFPFRTRGPYPREIFSLQSGHNNFPVSI